jgi:hypothetical protein
MNSKEVGPWVTAELVGITGGTEKERQEMFADLLEEGADRLSLIHDTKVEGALFDPQTGELEGQCWSDPETVKAKAKAGRQFSMNYRPGQFEEIFRDGPKIGKA